MHRTLDCEHSLLFFSFILSEQGLIELKLETTNDTEIRAAIVFAEGIFKNESIVIYPHDDLVSSKISVELRPPKDIAIDLHVKALVGYRASSHFHVFELSRHLPRFAMYGFVRSVSRGDNDAPSEVARPPPVGSPSDEFSEPAASVADRMADRSRQEWDHIYTSLSNTISNENFNAEVQQPKSFVAFRITDSLGKVVSMWSLKPQLRFGYLI